MTGMFFILYLLFLSINSSIQLSEITARNAAVCAYLSDKIVCYGGSPDDSRYDNSVYSLAIKNQTTTLVSEMNNKWDTIQQNSSALVTEFRYDSGFVPLPDGVSMFFEGGSNDNFAPIANKTVTYNTADNTWHALPDYYDPVNGGYRQIYSAAAVYMSDLNCIGFFGGKEIHYNGKDYVTLTGSNWSHLDTSFHPTLNPSITLHESFIGFFYMTLFNLTSNTWSVVPSQPPQIKDNHYPFLPIYQTATYYPEEKTVFFLGGVFHTTENEYVIHLTFAITFDTINSVWNNVTLKAPVDGSSMPAPRQLHSATLLNTKEDILVYGGTGDTNENPNSPQLALPDYAFTLNLKTLTWTSLNINVPDVISGPRFYHSAVLVDETSVFIMFGKPKAGISVTDTSLVLDVRNVSAISYSEYYPLIDNEPKTKKSGISTGAIVGIVIGVIAAVSIAIVAVLCIRRKKRADSKEKMQVLEVDWDNIDNGFTEGPPVPNTYYEESMTPNSTLVSSPQVPSSVDDHKTIRKSMYAPALASEINLTKPDGIDETIEYSIENNETKN